MPNSHHLFAVTRSLLNAAAVVSVLLIGILALGLGACVLAAAGLIHLPIPLDEVQGLPLNLIFEAAAIACFAGVMLLVLLALVFVLTAQIVKTADCGDPFIDDNARRLMMIAWLLLGMQVVGFAADTVMALFPQKLQDHINVGFDISPIGILAVLLIFVLAQIFRRGSKMRAELEGTV